MKEILIERLSTTAGAISTALTNGVAPSSIMHVIESALELEGRIEAHVLFEKGGKEFLVERLTDGANDGWSGRTNDMRRAKFDGFRTEARSLINR